MRLSRGNDGWHRITDYGGLPGEIYARVAEVDGALRVTELYLDGRGSPITTGGLRGLSLDQIEAAAVYLNGGSASLDGPTPPGPDLSTLATYYDTTFATMDDEDDKRRVRDSWVVASMWSQLGPRLRERVGVKQVKAAPLPPPTSGDLPEVVLAPREGRLTDDYLRDVARAYNAAVARGLPPAPTLGKLAGVGDKAVHAWVAEARRRGLMPPGRPGRLGRKRQES